MLRSPLLWLGLVPQLLLNLVMGLAFAMDQSGTVGNPHTDCLAGVVMAMGHESQTRLRCLAGFPNLALELLHRALDRAQLEL